MEQEAVGLLAAQSAMNADEFLECGDSVVGVDGAYDGQVTGAGVIGDTPRLPCAQFGVTIQCQRIFAAHNPGMKIARALRPQSQRHARIIIDYDQPDTLMSQQRGKRHRSSRSEIHAQIPYSGYTIDL